MGGQNMSSGNQSGVPGNQGKMAQSNAHSALPMM